MAISPDMLRLFPAPPDGRAEWAPVYLEPMVGSGERLTVAIAARSGADASVIPALGESVLACMYGKNADSVAELVDIVVESLRAHLADGAPFDTWAAPFIGTVHLGPVGTGLGSLEEVVRAGLRLTSSIANTRDDAALSAMPSEDAASPPVADPWEIGVRKAVLARRPEWLDRFNAKIKVQEQAATTRLGYLGPNVAANFLRLHPSGLSRLRQVGKAKLFDLRLARDHDALRTRANFELLLWRPTEPSVAFDERQVEKTRSVALELEDFANNHELRIETFSLENAAADRLMRLEA